jgi:hypothetical protein
MTRLRDNLRRQQHQGFDALNAVTALGRVGALQRATLSIIASSNVLWSRSGMLANDGVSGGHDKYPAILDSQVERRIFARRLARDRAAKSALLLPKRATMGPTGRRQYPSIF